MKRTLLRLVIVGAVVGAAGKAFADSPTSAGAPVTNVAPANPAPNIPSAFPHTLFISPDELQRVRADRDAALRANPGLAAEEKEIIGEIQAQQDKFDAAAIKADPKVAPIIAKLTALHHLGGTHAPSSAPGPNQSP